VDVVESDECGRAHQGRIGNAAWPRVLSYGELTAQVKMSLIYHRSTSALNTSVTTKEGVVTLGGKANNATEKNLATKLANDVNGVKSVRNQMTIE